MPYAAALAGAVGRSCEWSWLSNKEVATSHYQGKERTCTPPPSDPVHHMRIMRKQQPKAAK